MGDFKVGFSVGVYCTKCTPNSGVNTNFEITQCRTLLSRWEKYLYVVFRKLIKAKGLSQFRGIFLIPPEKLLKTHQNFRDHPNPFLNGFI
jgi:hypothetical protein